MTNPIISIHIPTNKETAAYTDQCIAYATKLAADPSRLAFYKYDTVHNGSVGHSQCLQRVFSSFKPGVNVTCDSDSALVRKDWDLIVLANLEHVDCLATTYEDWDKPPHNGDVIQSYKGKPHFIFSAFREGKPWEKLDFSETNTSVAVLIETDEQSKLYGLAKGRRVGHDCGWKTSHFWDAEGATFRLFNHSRSRLVLKNCPSHNEEYELDGITFVCHQRSSRKTPFRQAMSKGFYDAIDRYHETMLTLVP